MSDRILIVDDEDKIRRILVRLLSEEGYEVAQAGSGEEGLSLAREFVPDVVVMDQNLPGMSGQEATERLVEEVAGVKVVMITAFGAIDRAVDAMHRGAFDYLTKPFDNDDFLMRVLRAVEARQQAHGQEVVESGMRHAFGGLLGNSLALQRVIRVGRRAAQFDVPVMVEGESGTGKELLVRAIHQHSARHKGPFVPVNCAAVPGDLVESAFFGHEKGSFTGAGAAHMGWFEQANCGTLFLDEISEMPAALQAKLLRALEEKEITRVGGNAPISVDVRLIAATNRDALAAIQSGVLREDLYHRLAVISIRMPSLRERKEDIPLLTRHFLRLAQEVTGERGTQFSAETMACLVAYDWPGNVRELENAVRSAAIMAEGDVLHVCDLPLVMRQTAESGAAAPDIGALADAVELVERKVIAEVLAETNGNKSQAAERLEITRKTLHAKIVQYGLENSGKGEGVLKKYIAGNGA